MSLAHEDFQNFKPGDAHDPGDKGQTEIYGVHGGEVENPRQKGHKDHKHQEYKRSAHDPGQRGVGLFEGREDGTRDQLRLVRMRHRLEMIKVTKAIARGSSVA